MNAPARGGKRIGYVRVSTLDQNVQRQLDGIQLDKIFTDKASGRDMQRPQLVAMMDYAREGDQVVVHSMDRLARNVQDLLRIVDDLTKKGIVVQFMKESLTFTGEDSPIANLMLTIMGAVATFERALIRERQREGIELARRAGKYKGRKKVVDVDAGDLDVIRGKVIAGVTKARIAREMGISRQSLYKYLEAGKEQMERKAREELTRHGQSDFPPL
jgi:DNA invertase Pin-like site-specific DNA recombinase